MKKLNFNMTIIEMLTTMAEGKPGAANVLAALMSEYPIGKTSPDGLMCIIYLDNLGIRGPAVWVCYKDVCHEDVHALHSKIIDSSIKTELDKLKVMAR